MADPRPLHDHVLRIDIRVPRQRVWEEITRSGRIQPAVAGTILETCLVPGSKLRYYSPDRRRVFVVGEVVEVSPPHRFSHTYRFTTRGERLSLVTWELEEIAGGTRVTLIHSGWTDQVETHGDVAAGWRRILVALQAHLEGRKIPWRIRTGFRAMSALAFLLPRSTRVEEVEKAGW